MNRIEAIKDYAERIKREKELKEELKRKETNDLINTIETLTSRIKELVETANACLKNGINIGNGCYYGCPKGDEQHERGFFIAENIHHRVGFILDYGVVKYIGIVNVDTTFYTNGRKTFCISEKTGDSVEIKIEDMKKFINEFDRFESDFYNYIDNLIKSK